MSQHQDPHSNLRPASRPKPVSRRRKGAGRGAFAWAFAFGAAASATWFAPAPVSAEPSGASFVNYENQPIHAVDMSPNTQLLAVTNIPDARVEFFDLSSGTPVFDAGRSVQVGIDPVSVRFRTDGELWVVNQISDSISIVDTATRRVVATIPTLDEPFDVVFAGNPKKAFVSCSQVNTIQVFDITTHAEVGQVPINGEDPRGLAVSPDGSKVYAAIFESGNGTTLLGGGITELVQSNLGRIGYPPNVVNEVSGPYGGVNPPPNVGGPTGTIFPPINPLLPTPPKVSLIVRKGEDNRWLDDNGGDWTNFVSGADAAKSGRKTGWDLPDRDLAIINAETFAVSYVSRLMNICMAISVNPASGHVFMIGTDAINQVRFEPVVNGKYVKAMIAEVDPATNTRVKLADLNPHLTYATPQTTREERGKSLGDPRAIAWDSTGSYAYGVGMGSNNLMAYDVNLNRGLALPVNVGEGPVGIQLDEAHGLIYIFNRFASSLTVLNMWTRETVTTIAMHDSSPPAIKIGRKHLYDTHKNSGLGQAACGSCHIDGKMDRLAWDLGNPAGDVKPLRFVLANGGDGSQPHAHNLLGGGLEGANIGGLSDIPFKDFDPMKGPMTTQTLVDIIGHEPLHWRGDKDGLEEFNGAFTGLQGAERQLSPQEMQEFENMVATLTFPPNPSRRFNNSLPTDLPLPGQFVPEVIDPTTLQPKPQFVEGTPLPNGSAVRGLALYRSGGVTQPGFPNFFRNIDGGALACVTCHTLPVGSGTDNAIAATPDLAFVPLLTGPLNEHRLGLVSVDGSTNITMKIPQLRNMYEKVGFDATQLENNAGFGFLHDGGVDSIARFVTEPVFDVRTVQELADLVALMMSFSGSEMPQGTLNLASLDPPGSPSQDSHAGTGRQFTIASSGSIPLIEGQNALTAMLVEANDAEVDALVLGETVRKRGLDLIVKGSIGGTPSGWMWNSASQLFQSDRQSETISQSALLALAAPGQELTFTVVPRGSGFRLGIDRDLDGYYDLTEAENGTDPGNPGSVPTLPVITMHPQPQSVIAGSTVVFTVGAVGQGTLSYQWLKGNVEMGGQTSATLTLNNADPAAHTGSYRCRASTAAGPALSNEALLIVYPSGVNGAAFVGVSPDFVLPGQSFMMGVRMSNTSLLSWGLPQGYALMVNTDAGGVLGGATSFPIRSNDDVCAASTGQYTFTGQATAPPASGSFSVEFQMAQNGVRFGPVVNLVFLVGNTSDVNLATNSVGWFGGVVQGSGSVASGSSGLCMTAPLAGDNVMGWVSPERYAPLVDLQAYRVRVHALTSQTADLAIPLWDITYDNYNTDGTGNVYGGEALFIDTAGGAAGIGRAQGRSDFEVWAVPNAAETPQWRGTLPGGGNENSAFTPTADASNDLRLIIRALDLDSAGINAQIDSGTICLTRVTLEARALSTLAGTTVWNPAIDSSTHAPQTITQAAENAGWAVINNDLDAAVYALGNGTVPGSRKTLLPFDTALFDAANPAALAPLYPVQWNSNAIYKGTLLIRSNVGEGAGPEGGDPVDTVFVNMDTATSELVALHVALRGSPGNMQFAASPRLVSTAGGPQAYIGFLYGHNKTAMNLTTLPGADRLRLMGDFFNTPQIAPTGAGADSFAVLGMKIEELIEIVVN